MTDEEQAEIEWYRSLSPITRYQNYGDRSPECRAAWKEYTAARREKVNRVARLSAKFANNESV